MSRKTASRKTIFQAVAAAPFLPFAGWWGTWLTFALAAKSQHRLKQSTTIIPKDMRIDVVIPAHNEAATLGALLQSLKSQSEQRVVGTVLVVADHCTDNTAKVARTHGAEVLERTGGDNGKPVALRDGFAWLANRADQGRAVAVIDGDCVCGTRFMESIGYRIAEGAKAVQAAYTVADIETSPVRSVLSSSFALRNVVRASGAGRFKVPVGLFGSGMAFTYDVIDNFSFTDVRHTSSTDRRPAGTDVTMWFDLLEAGIEPVFADGAGVIALSPAGEEALKRQRLRWERAQHNTRGRGLKLLGASVRHGRIKHALALVDWSAPPLVPAMKRFVALAGMLGIVARIFRLPSSVFRAPALAVACLTGYLTTGIYKLHGPKAVFSTFLSIPAFIAWKLRLYREAEPVVDLRQKTSIPADGAGR